MNNIFLKRALLLAVISSLSACSGIETKVEKMANNTKQTVYEARERAAEPIPIISSSDTAFIMGAQVQIAEPELPILKVRAAYHPTKSVSLVEATSWITQNTGLAIDIAGLQTSASATTGVLPAPTVPSNSFSTTNATTGLNPANLLINYDGNLSGLLDILANQVNAWWKVVDGRITYFKTDTKTFYFPATARKFTSTSTITSSSSAQNTGSSSGGTTGSNSGGGTNTSDYVIDTWGELEKTAKIVAGNGQIAANRAAGSITVSGTPAQVRAVETWAKEVIDQQSQQIVITMHVYSVNVTNNDNYNWNPSVIFNSVAGAYGFSFSGPQTPTVSSGNNPAKFGFNVLSNATNQTQYSGSQLAFQALSSMGHITESIERTVTTLNGQPVPVQIANTQGYLAGSSTTITANVGSTTTFTPGSLTTGFTALFIPRIINGKIILGMDMQNSSNKGFTSITSKDGNVSIQNPNFDSDSNQQSVSLTPGDALLLTGLQRDKGAVNKSGVGKATNYTLGGGIDNLLNKQLTAIVITAKIL